MSLKYGHVDDVYEYRLNKYLYINVLYNVITSYNNYAGENDSS